MKKLIILFFTVLMSVTANAQLLYRITGNGVVKPSFLLGTYHLAPSTFADSIPGFRQAFQSSDQVCGELDMELMQSPSEMMKLQAAMMMPEGKTIQDLLTKEELQELNAFMTDILGVNLENPLMGAQLGKMNPAALTTQFSVAMYLKKNQIQNINDYIDTYVQKIAKEQGKKVIGFETVDDQIKALFLSQTLERQKQLMMCMVRNKDYQIQLSDDLVKAYFTQNLDQIYEVTDMKLNDECDSTPEEEAALIYDRNENWVKSMPGIMKSTPTFFAVGAAHIVGEKGLLNLLRNNGYQVDPVKN